ncbi:uncharacterized protein [Drosophila tropicalis]|uniref:uncharacterized protein n=1 Tax=Drosophila tropicalis TaxID=46794 RepID=UPI0035ABC31C
MSNLNINVQMECNCDHYRGIIGSIRYGITGQARPCRSCRRMMRRKQVVVVPAPVGQPVIQVDQAQMATHWQMPVQQPQMAATVLPPNYAQAVAAQ